MLDLSYEEMMQLAELCGRAEKNPSRPEAADILEEMKNLLFPAIRVAAEDGGFIDEVENLPGWDWRADREAQGWY